MKNANPESPNRTIARIETEPDTLCVQARREQAPGDAQSNHTNLQDTERDADHHPEFVLGYN